jgi:hypothetical protein
MFARLGFSIAVHSDPEVLLVDEVLSVGDVGFQRKCFDKMTMFKAKGTTIVFVSHNLQAVASLCDKAILLNMGTIRQRGGSEEVISYYLQLHTTATPSSSLIQLEKRSLLDERGEECNTFGCGQKAKAIMCLRFKEPFSNVYVTASIFTKNGMLIFWTDSASLTGQPLSPEKDQSVFFSVWLILNLSPGEYELRTTVFDRVAKQTIFQKTLDHFVIRRDGRSGAGMCFLDPQIADLKVSN